MPDTDSFVQVLSMAGLDGAPLDPPPEYAWLHQEAPISRHAGVDATVIAAWLGHDSVVTTNEVISTRSA
jgi:hypothetical protein